MRFKLLVAFVDDAKTHKVIEAARKAGATGATILNNAMGEGLHKHKTFLGLTMGSQRDVILMVVEEHHSRTILEAMCEEGEFETKKGSGMAFLIDIDDVVGISKQIERLSSNVEDKL